MARILISLYFVLVSHVGFAMMDSSAVKDHMSLKQLFDEGRELLHDPSTRSDLIEKAKNELSALQDKIILLPSTEKVLALTELVEVLADIEMLIEEEIGGLYLLCCHDVMEDFLSALANRLSLAEEMAFSSKTHLTIAKLFGTCASFAGDLFSYYKNQEMRYFIFAAHGDKKDTSLAEYLDFEVERESDFIVLSWKYFQILKYNNFSRTSYGEELSWKTCKKNKKFEHFINRIYRQLREIDKESDGIIYFKRFFKGEIAIGRPEVVDDNVSNNEKDHHKEKSGKKKNKGNAVKKGFYKIRGSKKKSTESNTESGERALVVRQQPSPAELTLLHDIATNNFSRLTGADLIDAFNIIERSGFATWSSRNNVVSLVETNSKDPERCGTHMHDKTYRTWLENPAFIASLQRFISIKFFATDGSKK